MDLKIIKLIQKEIKDIRYRHKGVDLLTKELEDMTEDEAYDCGYLESLLWVVNLEIVNKEMK